jgi:hypothetical protein
MLFCPDFRKEVWDWLSAVKREKRIRAPIEFWIKMELLKKIIDNIITTFLFSDRSILLQSFKEEKIFLIFRET